MLGARTLALVAALVAQALSSDPQASARRCLPFEPDTVAISGILVRRVFPGPPEFVSIRSGDAPEPGYYLHLARAVCARPSPQQSRDPDSALEARAGVRLVQLNLDSLGYARLRPRLGQRVTLRGTLSSSITGHHHAPLILAVVWDSLGAR